MLLFVLLPPLKRVSHSVNVLTCVGTAVITMATAVFHSPRLSILFYLACLLCELSYVNDVASDAGGFVCGLID